ncbi:2'-5' RNA ligase family protein [Streptomyces sp. NBC_01476]|uniref:2'-5' RNA ligase family protein n=1 Tax=Streptomyces sp. NBC_01476 TaxID=2903881 RepID=UPI002E32B81C|nr:2'-5' RNA ligase family protein [Streptomyces sp. NBC_01476]
MSDEEEPRWVAGETALLITVPEADPLVGAVREKHDASARSGIPAHVTVLYPFLPDDRIDDGVLAELREMFAGHEEFTLDFTGFGRFPELLWLAPEADGPVRALTAAAEARWPEAPPYGGAFDDVIPHLTVAVKLPVETFDAMERELAPGLPLRTRVSGVHLVVNDGVRWHHRTTFALHGSAPRGTDRPPNG